MTSPSTPSASPSAVPSAPHQYMQLSPNTPQAIIHPSTFPSPIPTPPTCKHYTTPQHPRLHSTHIITLRDHSAYQLRFLDAARTPCSLQLPLHLPCGRSNAGDFCNLNTPPFNVISCAHFPSTQHSSHLLQREHIATTPPPTLHHPRSHYHNCPTINSTTPLRLPTQPRKTTSPPPRLYSTCQPSSRTVKSSRSGPDVPCPAHPHHIIITTTHATRPPRHHPRHRPVTRTTPYLVDAGPSSPHDLIQKQEGSHQCILCLLNPQNTPCPPCQTLQNFQPHPSATPSTLRVKTWNHPQTAW